MRTDRRDDIGLATFSFGLGLGTLCNAPSQTAVVAGIALWIVGALMMIRAYGNGARR